jgi:hypothetical protein
MFPDIHISGAGLMHVNGFYMLVGWREGAAMCTNGVCKIVREDTFWVFLSDIGIV